MSRANSYEIIDPPNKLIKKAKILRGSAANFDPVARAEQALEQLSVNFSEWMDNEVSALYRAWDEISKNGFDKDTSDKLFRSAHDIKGQAATLGFPLAGSVANSLCNLLECVPDISKIPLPLLEKHVQGIRAIVAENAEGSSNKIAATLADQLAIVTDEFLEKIEAKVD